MGQNHSASIEFEDVWSASDVTRGRVKCLNSCPFTNYTKQEFTTDPQVSITCKVYESQSRPIAFGLVPAAQTQACRNHMVGQSGISGSVGCHVSPGNVKLVKDSRIFFDGDVPTKGVFTITMRISQGSVSFFVNGAKARSDALERMKFRGKYRLGISMIEAGQEAEAFFNCPVTFKDTWSAGGVLNETLYAAASTNFTFFSNQLIKPRGRYVIIANVIENMENSVALGTLPANCTDLCRSNLVGMKPGSIGCLIKDGHIFVAINGDVVFASDVNTSNPCVIAMTIDNGSISFKFDGKNVNCDELKPIRLTEDFRIGVGLSFTGQVVEMRGDRRSPSEASSSLDGGGSGRLMEAGFQHLIRMLEEQVLTAASDSSDPTWHDNMRSINCNSDDKVAVSVMKFTATLYSKCLLSASGQSSIDIRILNMKPRALMMVGVMDEKTDNHSNNHLGASTMNNSLCVTSRGDLLLKGSTRATGNGFTKGSLISLSLDNGKLSIKVNGREAVSELSDLSFTSNFRWAVSFTDVGQAVKIGSGALTRDELDFCTRNGVSSPSTGAGMKSKLSMDSSTRTSLTSLSSRTSASSHDDAIEGCFIDAEELTYNNRKGTSLGEGSFGKVFKGKWDDTDVAIKEIAWEDDESQRREVAIGRSLAQPNIVSILGWSKQDNKLLVVMPLFVKGSLEDKLAKVSEEATPKPGRGGPFGFNFFFKVSIGLLRAIKYMASRKPNPVVHRDIKPANILLDDNDKPMLTDFGTARTLRESFASTNCGTPFYMAAEQINEEGATTATDVHAATLVIYEVLCAPRPVREFKSPRAFMNDIRQGKLPQMNDVPKDIAVIMKPAFSANPRERPTAASMAKSFEAVLLKMRSA